MKKTYVLLYQSLIGRDFDEFTRCVPQKEDELFSDVVSLILWTITYVLAANCSCTFYYFRRFSSGREL